MSVSPKHIVVAVNPRAAFGKNVQAGEETCRALRDAGHEVTLLEAESYELLSGKLHRALQLTPDALVVVGGDGMVSLAVNHVAQTSIPFTVVPAGTGNDLARGIGFPVGNISESISEVVIALENDPQRLDLGRVISTDGQRVRWFASILSAGFDAVVNERANSMKRPRGKSRYTLALLRELFTFKPISYELLIDGNTRTEKAMLVSVANNKSMGGGMMVTPEASMQDGLLDLFLLKPVSTLRFLWLFPRVFKGTHVSEKEVEIIRCTSVRLSAPNVVAYADGERVWQLPVVVDVVPSAVRIFMNPKEAD